MNSKYLDEHWTPIYNKRLEWAYRANEILINKIESDSVKDRLDSDPKKIYLFVRLDIRKLVKQV
ncbi:MAG: hypothetical protein IPG24_16150 [Leptospiraceae bacterium]|nr:hypothetical protein [Leptospiraceae bacterium]